MKQGGFKAVCLVLLACMAVSSVYAEDDKAVNLESKVLESFNGDSGYIWKVSASKFATTTEEESFPKLAYVSSWPAAVYGYNNEGDDIRSLGIWGRFDRQGYNWIDMYPVAEDAGEDAEPAEIHIPGRVQMFDIWVWGSNYNHYLELYVRDYLGVVHIINFGNLHFTGWKNLRVNIPSNIPQARRNLPLRQGLSLVKMRLWTKPGDRVDDFQVYFHQLKILTDMFESIFDGDELSDPERVQDLWSAGINQVN